MAPSIFHVLLLFASLYAAASGSEADDVSVAHVYADVGSNVSLPCLPQSLRSDTYDYTPSVNDNSVLAWIREGKALQHSRVEPNGILMLTKITSADSGLYVCQVEQSYSYSDTTLTKIAQVELHVKTTPPAPVSLTVYPSSVLALVTWKLNSTGGYPLKSITVVYQEVLDDWGNPAWHRTYPEELEPTTTQLEIYKLQANTTYRFRVWATNKLGPGDYAEAIATTRDNLSPAAVHGSLASTRGRLEANPWILSTRSRPTHTVVMASCIVAFHGSFFLSTENRSRARSRVPVFEMRPQVLRFRFALLAASPASVVPAGEPTSPMDWVPPTAEPHLALKYMEQLPSDQQPIVGSQAAAERKRALERQLPSYDLDPDRCQSLTAKEKRKYCLRLKSVTQLRA
nr:EOG090X0B8X [Moina brachiata]